MYENDCRHHTALVLQLAQDLPQVTSYTVLECSFYRSCISHLKLDFLFLPTQDPFPVSYSHILDQKVVKVVLVFVAYYLLYL